MLYSTERLRGAISLNSIPRILANEAVDYIDLVPVKTSKRLGYKIIALEDAYKYMNRNAKNFDSFLEEITYVNSIPPGNLAFSVRPSSLYNTIIQEMYINLQETMPIYLSVNKDSREYKLINYLCEECINLNSTDPMNFILNEFLSSFLGGASKGAGDAATDGFMGLVNNLGEKARSALVTAGQNQIDDFFGKHLGLDTTEKRAYLDNDGSIKSKEVTVRGGGIKNKVANSSFFNSDFWKRNPNWRKTAVEFVSDAGQDIRKSISSGAMDLLQNVVGIDPNRPFNLENMIDAISNKVSSLRQTISGNGNPGLINTIINKLIALKNQLLGKRR